MRVGSLFSGIGGIEIGLERAGGFSPAWFVEWNPFCQKILKKAWPEVPVYGDVTKITWETMPPIDVLTGGFPCQPFSVAGKRKGSNDERDLWPECKRAIRALKPKVCLFENVPGLLTSEKGEFFKRIIDDCYQLGYKPQVYGLSARDVGAPHLRKRIFLVLANTNSKRHNSSRNEQVPTECGVSEERKTTSRCKWKKRQHEASEHCATVSNTNDTRCKKQWKPIAATKKYDSTEWGHWWAIEPDVGRVVDGIPFRVDRIKCLGNAVVPQCAQVIGTIIKETEGW